MPIFTAVLTTLEPDAFGPWAFVFVALYVVAEALSQLTQFVERYLPILLALSAFAVWFVLRLSRRAAKR